MVPLFALSFITSILLCYTGETGVRTGDVEEQTQDQVQMRRRDQWEKSEPVTQVTESPLEVEAYRAFSYMYCPYIF